MIVSVVYLLSSSHQLIAGNFNDIKEINKLVNICFEDAIFCEDALIKIHDYQETAERNRDFPCQTRLLGLEANLIMAMNDKLQRNKAKSIIDAVKKYC